MIASASLEARAIFYFDKNNMNSMSVSHSCFALCLCKVLANKYKARPLSMSKRVMASE